MALEPADLPWQTLIQFYTDVHRACLLFSASVTGGVRTAKRNVEVGGSEKSRHQFDYGWGAAWDLFADDNAGRDELADHLRSLGYHVSIGDNYPPRQLHVQLHPPGNLRWPA